MLNKINVKNINEVIYHEKLDNGLNVYMHVNNKTKMYYATLSVKYGSINLKYKYNNKIYETPTGIAHYMEHIKFNISKDYTAHDMFFKSGTDVNAFTTFNYTNYLIFGNNNILENINNLLDFVQKPYFTKSLINKERGIIQSERNMSLDDPYSKLTYGILNNIFHNKYLYSHIVGTKEDINNINIDNILNIYDAFYTPSNMNLVITGNFNPYKLISSIKENQSNKEFNSNKCTLVFDKEKDDVKTDYLEEYGNVECDKIRIAIKDNINNHKIDKYKLLIMSKIIFNILFGDTSIIKNDLIDNELVNFFYTSVDIIGNSMVYLIHIDTNYKEEVLERINNVLSNTNIYEEDFSRIKKTLIASLILAYEDIEIVNDSIQNELITFNKIYNNKFDIINSISYKDIIDYINKINFNNRSVYVLKPNQK